MIWDPHILHGLHAVSELGVGNRRSTAALAELVDGVVNDATLFLVMCLIWTPQHILFVFHLLSLILYLCPLLLCFDPRDFYFNHLLFLPELSCTYLILLYLGLEHMEQIFLILTVRLDCLKDIFFFFQRKHLKTPIFSLAHPEGYLVLNRKAYKVKLFWFFFPLSRFSEWRSLI